MTPVPELIGTGRSADVYAHGAGEVLRRYREPRDTEREVAAMEHARARGFPAPAARALNATEIVMERVPGSTMLDDLGRRPWRIARHAAMLASLHERLHAIEAPDWLPAPLGEGATLLHLDLQRDHGAGRAGRDRLAERGSRPGCRRCRPPAPSRRPALGGRRSRA
jgi:hypothetical protein